MSRRVVAVIAAVTVAAISGLAVWNMPLGPDRPPTVEVAPSPPKVITAATRAAQPAPPGELRFRRVEAETGGEAAEACLVFDRALPEAGVRWEDYVIVKGGAKVTYRTDAKRRLCLGGLGFGVDYVVTLRAGLPGTDDVRLAEAVDVPVGFGDRRASLSFGPGLILPRESGDGVPVTTVNADSLDVRVLRVGARMVARMRQDFAEGRTFYQYQVNQIRDDEGQLLWSGKVEVKGPRNEAVVSHIPVGELMRGQPPGIYLINAAVAGKAIGDDDEEEYGSYYRTTAGQWIVHSDIGLTAFTADGLTVFARSLATAKPIAGMDLVLVARNNEELARAQTDSSGRARFDPGLMRGAGGAAPVMVMAYGARADYNFLDLRRSEFDLSDRGVDGRPPAGPVDAFLYTERGIYRPGETVELVGLLRDAEARSLAGRPAVVKLFRPDGREFKRWRLEDKGGGAIHVPVALPPSANRGMWHATAHAEPDAPAIGKVSFEVQDFVPQRLGLTIGERPAVLRPGTAVSIPVEARFLYGAPASDLGGEAELLIEPDPAPHPAHKGFRWGHAGEQFKAGERVTLEVPATDAEGRTTVTGKVGEIAPSSLPLRAEISIAIREPGGRTTSERITVPVRTRALDIGIRPHFTDSVRQGSDAVFDVIAVDDDGNLTTRQGLAWRVTRQEHNWQWYRRGTEWRYEAVTREREIATGTISATIGDPAVLRQRVGWGSYKLTVTDPVTRIATSVPFYAGWYGGQTADRPDRLTVAADRPGYGPGETAHLNIEADADGEALLVVANERIHETRLFKVSKGGNDVSVAVKPEWGPGAYALITMYRPMDAKLGHAPVRAVGVAWLGLDPARRTLAIDIGSPQKVGPRGKLAVPVKVSALGGGGLEHAHVTLAAVDQGILQLTRFQTPNPAAHFLSKRRLGIGMRDDYGRLIRLGAGSGDGQGGDGQGGKGLDVVPTRTVALFSGVVPVGRDGSATISLDIPDFQGELRLMAVAFDATRVGSAERRLTVRDPLVAELILPRFLAPGDNGRATVLIHNVEGAAGDYRLAVSAGDAVRMGEGTARTLSLPVGKREIYTIPIEAGAAGIGSVELAVDGPGFQVRRAWPIQVRPAQLPITREMVDVLRPGEPVALDKALLAGFVPGTEDVAVSVSRWQGVDVPGLLRWLDRYPFGCLEQTTSRAMPLLYFNDVAMLAGKKEDKAIQGRVQDAVDRLLSMQAEGGDFRMWGGWGSSADPWLSVFALDFLHRAADKGYDVPEAPLKLGRKWLAGQASSGAAAPRAYASTVLAKLGQANPADLRYFHDNRMPDGALPAAQLAAALDATGDRARASSAYDVARKRLQQGGTTQLAYGSNLRDVYAVAATLAGGGRSASVPAVLDIARSFDTRVESTTTQEKAWMLLAAAEMARNAGKLSVDIAGQRMERAGDPLHLPLDSSRVAEGVTLVNRGDGDIFRIVSVQGVPAEPLPPAADGVAITKTFHTLDGMPADMAAIKRNDRLVVVIDGMASGRHPGDYAVLDLLPAGLEIEGVVRPGKGYPWLGTLSETELAQGRDDRFIATVSLPIRDRDEYGYSRVRQGEDAWSFRVAYAVRAVTPGEFALPAATAEHMYVPAVKARTDIGRMAIAE